MKAATVQANDEQTNIFFSGVIRDSEQPDHIYDLAFALPAITAPLHQSAPKQYPSLYLYSHRTRFRHLNPTGTFTLLHLSRTWSNL